MNKKIWELVRYPCTDGDCLMIHRIPNDSKLGALSLDHQDIGEAVVEELNLLENEKDKKLMEIIDKKILCNTRRYHNTNDKNIRRECEIRLKLLENIKKEAEK